MSHKSNVINYITLILAIITITSVFYTLYFKLNKIYSVLLLILTLIFSSISRKLNESETNLNDKDRKEINEALNKIKGTKSSKNKENDK